MPSLKVDRQTDRKRRIRAHRAICTGGLKSPPCNMHRWAQKWVLVAKNPYFAIGPALPSLKSLKCWKNLHRNNGGLDGPARKNREEKCHGCLTGMFSLPQQKPVKRGKPDTDFVQGTYNKRPLFSGFCEFRHESARGSYLTRHCYLTRHLPQNLPCKTTF